MRGEEKGGERVVVVVVACLKLFSFVIKRKKKPCVPVFPCSQSLTLAVQTTHQTTLNENVFKRANKYSCLTESDRGFTLTRL